LDIFSLFRGISLIFTGCILNQGVTYEKVSFAKFFVCLSIGCFDCSRFTHNAPRSGQHPLVVDFHTSGFDWLGKPAAGHNKVGTDATYDG